MNFNPDLRSWATSGFKDAAAQLLAPLARSSDESPKQRPLPAPHINLRPVIEQEIDGHIVFRPSGAIVPIGHVAHFHGFGGITNDEKSFYWDMAAGKFFDERAVVVAPLAHKVAPNRGWRLNAIMLRQLMEYSKQLSGEIKEQLAGAIGLPEDKIGQARMAIEAVGSPRSWYPFLFKEAPLPQPYEEQRRLQPDYEAILPYIIHAAEHVVKRTDKVLDMLGAVDGRVCAVGFSQGVGVAIGAASRPGQTRYTRLVLVSGSHVQTDNAPKVDRSHIETDVILPMGDEVMAAIGKPMDKVRAELREGFDGNAWLWTNCKGNHSFSGEAAELAGRMVIGSLRERRRATQPMPA